MFYDMKKDPAHCPACGEKVDQQPLLKPRRTPTTKLTTKPLKISEKLTNSNLSDVVEDVDIDNEDVELNDEDVDISTDDDEGLIVDEDMDDSDLPEVAEHIDADNNKD
tara:strand:+ start:732 stop:1055 length:324 start_codon:yes stop_codon:yes gene_type:complete